MARRLATTENASKAKRSAQPKSANNGIKKKTPASKNGRTNSRNKREHSNALGTALNRSVDAALDPNLDVAIDPSLENYSIQFSATSFNANNPDPDQLYPVLDENATPEERAAFVGYAEVGVDSNGQDNLANQNPLTRSPSPIPMYAFIDDYFFDTPSEQDNIRLAAAAARATMEQLRNSNSGISSNLPTAATPGRINATTMTKREAEAAAVPEHLRRPRPEMPTGRFTHLIKLEDPASFIRSIPAVADAISQVVNGEVEFETKARAEEGNFRANIKGLIMFLWKVSGDSATKVEDTVEADTFHNIKYTAAANLPEFNIKLFDREEGAPKHIRQRLVRLYQRIIATQYGFWDIIEPEQLRCECELEVRKWVLETLSALTKKCAEENEKYRPLNNKSQEHVHIIGGLTPTQRAKRGSKK